MSFSFLVIVLFLLLASDVLSSSTYIWRNLTSDEYTHWYTRYEIAHLEDDSRNDNPFNFFCNQPHSSTHPHFKMGLEGYSDIRDNKLLPLLKSLWRDTNNVTLIVIGDSITTNNRIRFFILDIKRNFYGDIDEKQLKKITQGENSRVEIHNLKTNQKISIHGAHFTPNELNKTTGNYHENAIKVINYVNLVEKRNAMIMFMMSARFNKEDKLLSQIMPMVQWLQSIAQRKAAKNKVIWLTTIPQHYKTKNGYLNPSSPVPNKTSPINQCRPLIDSDPKKDIRNELVRQYLHNINDQNIEIFDDRDIFVPLYNHHSTNTDCSHYCYHPIIQQPLYEHMSKWLKHFGPDIEEPEVLQIPDVSHTQNNDSNHQDNPISNSPLPMTIEDPTSINMSVHVPTITLMSLTMLPTLQIIIIILLILVIIISIVTIIYFI